MVEVELPKFFVKEQKKENGCSVNLKKLRLYILIEQIKIDTSLREIEKEYLIPNRDHTFSYLFLTYFMMYFCLGIMPPNISNISNSLPFAASYSLGTIIALNLFIGMGTMIVLGYFGGKIYTILSRKAILTITNSIWISCYGFLALVPNFFGMMLLISIGAIGVGAFLPIGFSMISDLFTSKQRGIRFGMMHLALVLGNGCGMIVGSLLGSIDSGTGWRLAYAISSQLALFPLLSFTWFGKNPKTEYEIKSLYIYAFSPKETISILKQKSLLGILGTVLGSWIAMSTMSIWSILYLSHEFGYTSIATTVYILAGLGALPGAVLGGKLGDSQHHKGNPHGRIIVSFLGSITGVCFFFFFYAIPILFFFGIIGYFFTAFAIGNQFALYSELVPPQFRGTVNALNGIMMNSGGIIGNLFISSCIRVNPAFLQGALFFVLGVWGLSLVCWILPFNYYFFERIVPSRHKVLVVS